MFVVDGPTLVMSRGRGGIRAILLGRLGFVLTLNNLLGVMCAIIKLLESYIYELLGTFEVILVRTLLWVIYDICNVILLYNLLVFIITSEGTEQYRH